ncbi:hypothetical protein D3C72_1862080 [compost metagenome]
MQQRLPHANVGHQRIVWSEGNAVVDATGWCGIDRKALILGLLLIVSLDLANKVRLPGLQRANPHAVFRGDDHLDGIQIGPPLLSQLGWSPTIVLAYAEIDLAPQGFTAHHKRTRADNMARITQFIVLAVQRTERY